MNFLSGYRTYIIVALFVLCVVLERFLGFDIPGFEAGDNWLELVMAMLGLGTLRAGIAKVAA
jgi:hypothetical protein